MSNTGYDVGAGVLLIRYLLTSVIYLINFFQPLFYLLLLFNMYLFVKNFNISHFYYLFIFIYFYWNTKFTHLDNYYFYYC